MNQSQEDLDRSPANTHISTFDQIGERIRVCQQCQKSRRSSLFKTMTLCIFCDMENFGNTAIWIPCPHCGKEVNKLREEGKCWDCVEDEIKLKVKDIALEKKLENLFGSTEAVKWFTFDNWDPLPSLNEPFESCFSFDPSRENLYLWGKSGRGKTHLVYAIAIKQLKAGRSVKVLTVRELVGKFWKKNVDNEISEMDNLRKADVLIIDELGQGKDTEFALSVLADVLNKQALNVKNGLVITSNLSLDDLAEKYHEDRIASRLGGMCKIIEMISDFDYRLERVGK